MDKDNDNDNEYRILYEIHSNIYAISTRIFRIVLQYEYCRRLLSSTSGKTIYFSVILPHVREKISLSYLIFLSRINGPAALLSYSPKNIG